MFVTLESFMFLRDAFFHPLTGFFDELGQLGVMDNVFAQRVTGPGRLIFLDNVRTCHNISKQKLNSVELMICFQ